MAMEQDFQDAGTANLMRGRKFSGHELQLMVLGLLQRRSCHGYEIIKELQALSLGFYSPSPGALYPVLARIVEYGYALSEVDGKRKRYTLSDKGRLYLESQSQAVELLFARLRHAAKKMHWISHGADVQAAASATGWLPEFVTARARLRSALLARSDADHDEQRRLVTILDAAVARIENKPKT